MRKITLFLALLFVTIGAVAQVYQVTDTKYTSADLNAKTEATYIAIKNLSATNHYYFVGNTGAAPYSKADFSNDAVFIWEPVAGETGKFYLKKLNGTYMQATSPKDFGTIENAAQFTTTNPTSTGSSSTLFNGDGDSQAYINGNDDPNLIRFVKGSNWINVQNGDSGTPTYNTGTGGWTIHYAYAVEEKVDANVAQVTYNYQLQGVTKKSVILEQEIGTAYAAPTFDYITFTQPDGIVTAEGAIINIDCTQTLPFTVSENFETAAWYYMTIRSNDEKYVVRSETAPYVNSKTLNNSDNSLWAFMGNVFDGIQVINKGAGNSQTLGCDNTATASDIYMKNGSTSWIIEKGNGGFLLRQSGTNEYAHDYDNKLQFWNNGNASSDPGSAFKVYSETELLEAWKTNAITTLGYVGGYPTSMTETINAISTYADALAFDEANSGAKIALNTEAYYRLVCVSPKTGNSGNTSYNTLTYNGASNLVTAPKSNSNVNQIFKFEDAGDGKYYLLNLNANKYLNKIAAGTYRSSVVEKTDACIIEILALNADAQWKFHNSESTNDKHCLFAENHPGEEVPYACAGWENGANSASAWYILPVSELEVALTPIDGASYATGYYPFPVSVSGNTTLNVGTLNADKSKLSLTTAEGVPSNTGIVMVNSAAETTATLTIGGEFSVSNNALSGTCTAIALDGTNNSNYLVFGRSAGVLGFYRPSANVEAIAANKAFLATNELSAVKLNIGNDVTAIEDVELGNGDAPIFDLSGRRVLAPVKGGIYIRDGKKYIVK